MNELFFMVASLRFVKLAIFCTDENRKKTWLIGRSGMKARRPTLSLSEKEEGFRQVFTCFSPSSNCLMVAEIGFVRLENLRPLQFVRRCTSIQNLPH